MGRQIIQGYIMNCYNHYGHRDFVLCLDKSDVVRAMNTLRDRQLLNMVETGQVPWRPLSRVRAGGAS